MGNEDFEPNWTQCVALLKKSYAPLPLLPSMSGMCGLPLWGGGREISFKILKCHALGPICRTFLVVHFCANIYACYN